MHYAPLTELFLAQAERTRPLRAARPELRAPDKNRGDEVQKEIQDIQQFQPAHASPASTGKRRRLSNLLMGSNPDS